MWVALFRVVLATLAVAAVLAALLRAVFGWPRLGRPVAAVDDWNARRRPPAPATRPVEDLALAGAPARHAATTSRRAGQRFAKTEGLRLAYDAVLAEACTALGVTHLLAVLPPGAELDAERRRVEWALEVAGLEPRAAAQGPYRSSAA